MFDPASIVGAKMIKTQTVFRTFNFAQQSRSQGCPLGWIDFAFKDRILNALTKI